MLKQLHDADDGECRRPRGDHDRRAGQARPRGQGRDRSMARATSSGSARRPSASTATPSPVTSPTSASSSSSSRSASWRRSRRGTSPTRCWRGRWRRRWRSAARSSASLPARRRSRRWRWRVLAERAGLPAGLFIGAALDAFVRSRQGVLLQRDGAQDQLHRLDRGRPHPDAAGGGPDQAAEPRARRQRALHRLRRRRPRCGGRWRADLASTATTARPASAPTASTCRPASTTRSPRSSSRRREKLKVGDGFEDGVNLGPLIDKKAVDKVASAHRGRAAQGRQADARRQAQGGAVLRADGHCPARRPRCCWRARRRSARSRRSSGSRRSRT